MGTILTGVKLETLSKEAKDELALLICERKVVILREQLDFLKAGPQFQVSAVLLGIKRLLGIPIEINFLDFSSIRKLKSLNLIFRKTYLLN